MLELLGIILLLFFVWLHYKNVESGSLKRFYFGALALKIFAGIGVGLIYQYYYTGGDTWNYFYQAEQFNKVAFLSWNNFGDLFISSKYELIEGFAYVNQPRAALMVKLVAIVNLITSSNYWITSAYFSFFSFMGVWAFSTWVYNSFKYGKVAAVALFIWPSFVFWSSGILKESVAVGLLFGIIANCFKMLESKSVSKLISLIIAVYLLFLIKYYFAVVLFVILAVYGIIALTKLHKKSILWQTAAWILMLFTGMVLGGFLHPNLEPLAILGVVITNNQAFVKLSNSHSLVQFINTSTEWIWLLINAPKALFAGLFLPLGFTNSSIVYSISALENWILLILFVRGLLLIKLENLKLNFNLLLASISYIIMLAIFLTLSTPNLGTLARYKIAFIPVFLVLVLMMNKFRGTKYFRETLS